MTHIIKQSDISLMLKAVEHSVFENLDFHINGTKLTTSRTLQVPKGTKPKACTNTKRIQIFAPKIGYFHPEVVDGMIVNMDTLIGNIRSFKSTFPIKAGAKGRITLASTPDGKFVEYGRIIAEIQISEAGEKI